AGDAEASSCELLTSRRMATLLDELSQGAQERVVILDTAPLLASSEPAVLAPNAGQVVMVVEAECTGRHAVEEALGQLGDCPNIGLVLNKARRWLSSEQFGAYYGQMYS